MTKKHFEAIAAAMKLMRDLEDNPVERAGMDKAIYTLAAVCAESNGRFQYNRFTRACGL
jgi:hypothetical protein